jgi:hypothetical protein
MDLLSFTAELVDIPSVSHNERAITDHIEELLRAVPWLDVERVGENLVARTTEFFIDPSIPADEALKILIAEVERASSDLQCEASLLFLPAELASHQATWKQLGYEPRTPQSLGVQAWTDAAIDSAQPNAKLFFKQLRQDRVLRPI